MPEYKQLAHATKEINDRTVIGIAAVHGNVDEGGDKSWPGSFADITVDGRMRAVFLWMHNAMEPPTAAINYIKEVPRNSLPVKVLEYAPDATGGVEVSRTYLETPRGNEILTGLKAGAITEMSYAYNPIQYDFEEVDGQTVRNLRKIELFDLSDVAWGMNDATLGVKGQPLHMERLTAHAAVERYIKRVEALYALRVVKEGRRFSSATVQEIETTIADLRKGNTVANDAIDRLEKLIAPSDDGKAAIRQLLLETQRTLATINGVRPR